MLPIDTFDQKAGGNVLYKALAHPIAAERGTDLAARLAGAGPLALFDPDGVAPAVFALHPWLPAPSTILVQDVAALGREVLGCPTRPVTELAQSGAQRLLVCAFDAARTVARLAPFLPPGAEALSLDALRLPETMLTQKRRYLDRQNFATNLAFFRDQGGLCSRLTSANYWAGYGAPGVRLWLRLFDGEGRALATWEETLPDCQAAFSIDSREVRARFGLPEFAGQLFVHAIGAAGHDVVKYALDTYGEGGARSLSVTHDANAWPADRYAGLPAPREDETVTLWLQNSHAAPIPAGAIALDRMGEEAPVSYPHAVPGFASVPVDVGSLLPGLRWPGQIELRTGRHVVRPRYEVTRAERTRIAHVNVERADLKPDPGIKSLSNLLGRGYLLPFPVLPPDRYRSIVQPTPMAESQHTLPIRLDVFDEEGRLVGQHPFGTLPRRFDIGMELDRFGAAAGHAELVYDFRDGGDADGWLHGLFRYEDRESGHAAETSFGAHIFNTAMTYRDEPQSYAGPPPGLSTRLFLKLGFGGRESFAVLIYPASAAWHPRSSTTLMLMNSEGEAIAEHELAIACSGSALVRPHAIFGAAAIEAAGERGYVLVRDTTCRLFGYHGLMDGRGGFSLDHMFGF